MSTQIDLFNKYRDIQHTPIKKRILENFTLYHELFKTITIKENPELKNLKINLFFLGENNDMFDWIIDNKYIGILINLQEITTEEFDDFIFGRKTIYEIIEACCLSAGMDIIGVNWKIILNNVYESWDNYLNCIGYSNKNLISSPEIEKMKVSLDSNHIVWCHNISCSGKTYAGIGLLKSAQKRMVYNPCFQSSCSYDFVKLILSLGRDVSLLIDDIQCDIDKAKEIFNFIANNYHEFKKRIIRIFIISWSSLLKEGEFKRYSTIIPTFSTNPNDYIELLKSKISDSTLLSVCGENIALLNAVSKVPAGKSEGSEKSLFEIFVHTTDSEKIKQIYKLCVLGIYEYSATEEFLGSPVISSDDINTLKIAGSKYYAGHREICQFIASYIEQMKILGLQERYAIIQDYIKTVDNNNKWRALKQLVGEDKSEDLSAISPIWSTLNCFEQEIKMQTQKDPSWGNTPSSMYFVLNTASLLGIAGEYQNVLRAFCDMFLLSDSAPLISLKYQEMKTTNDFKQIRIKMIAEDHEQKSMDFEGGENFNCDAAHKNWVLGLIVGLKGILIQAGYKTLYDKAIEELFHIQDPDGFWYPKRVPWVTARIIIGLSQAGYTIADHHVNKAVDYLFDILGDNRSWDAHTGGWNSEYETSSLCLEAIFRSGFKYKSNSSIIRVSNYLIQQKDVWMAEKNEIDGSATACSLLKLFGIRHDLLKYITNLCERCIYYSIPGNEQLDLNRYQSCNTTQIASYTIELCWYIFKRDLPYLLEQFVKRSSYKEKPEKRSNMKKIFISYSDDGKGHVLRVKKISDKLKSEGYIVYFYADAPLGTNNIKFMQNIESCDIIIIIGTSKYREKAMSINKGGVFFEENVIGDAYMNNKYDRIIPIAFDDFSTSFPTPFNINKGIRCKRVTTNFLIELVKEINKK